MRGDVASRKSIKPKRRAKLKHYTQALSDNTKWCLKCLQDVDMMHLSINKRLNWATVQKKEDIQIPIPGILEISSISSISSTPSVTTGTTSTTDTTDTAHFERSLLNTDAL